MDKPERRKDKDESGDAPVEDLGPEANRRPSESSAHPKEREETPQERPDPRYLNEELHRELSEASQRDERIDQPVEMARKDGIDAKSEHPVELAEERRLADNPDAEFIQEKGTAPERFVRTMDDKQMTHGTQLEGVREHPDPSEQPLESEPMPRESNSQTEEESGGYEKVEQNQLKPAEAEVKAERTDGMDAKTEQKGPTVKQLPESQGHESRLPEKETPEQLTGGEERQCTSKTQAEKIREPQVEQLDSRPSLSKPEPQESNSKRKESASGHHAEQEEKVAQEKPDHRYPSKDMPQISETSQQHGWDNRPSEATRAQDTHAKPEQMEAQSDSTPERLPESLDRVTAATKEQFPQLPVRTDEKQTMEVPRQEKESIPPMERADNSKGPRKNELILDESNSRNDIRTPEPVVTQTDPRAAIEFPDRLDNELGHLGKRAISEQPKGTEGDNVTRENQAEMVRELSNKQANNKESPQTNLVTKPTEHLEQPVLHDAMWYKKLTDTKRVQRLTIKSNGRIVFPAEYLERTVPDFKRGQEAILECTSEGKTFYCKYRGADKNGPVKHMIAFVPNEIGQPHEKRNFVFDQLTPEAFAKRFPETRFPDAFTPAGPIPANSTLRSLNVKDGKASLEIKEGVRSRTLEGLVKDFGYDEHARSALMKIEIKDERNTIAFTVIHNGIGRAHIESTNETALREDITATLNEIEAKGGRSARGVANKFIYDLEKTGSINPQTLDDVRILTKNALEYSPNALVSILAYIRRDFANLGPENALKVLHSYVDKESPLPRIYTTHIQAGKIRGKVDIPRLWREIRGLQNGETYALTLKDKKGTSLTVMQELRSVSSGIWHIHFDKDISRTFPDRTLVDVTICKSEMGLIVKELSKTLPQTVRGVRDIRMEDKMLHLDIWNRMFSQSYTLEMHPGDKPSYQSAKIAGACLYSKCIDYSGKENYFRFIYKSDHIEPVMQYLDNNKFRRVTEMKYYDPFKRIEILLPKRSYQSIYIDEFMGKGEEDRETVLSYYGAENKKEKAIIGHNSVANYLIRLEGSREPNEIVKYIDKVSNTPGPDLVFDDRHGIFASGRGIVEVKSQKLDLTDQGKNIEIVSSSLTAALSDLHRYLYRKPIKQEGLNPFVPDFGLAVSQIFDKAKGQIIRTIVVSIRNSDGSYTERNWREIHEYLSRQ